MRRVLIGIVVLAVIATACKSGSGSDSGSAAQLTTPRGTRVSVVLSWPDPMPAQAPAIIIAPGGTYHAAIPVVRRFAERAAAHGFVAVRFDWSFCDSAAGRCAGKRSADLQAEREDLETVVAFVRTHARVDRARILLAAKSFGSRIAYPVFVSDPSIRALAVLTPICTETAGADGRPLAAPLPTASQHYPDLSRLDRPALFAIGVVDPICRVAMLRDYLAATPGKATILELPGDHSFEVGADAAQNAANITAAADRVLQWATDSVR